MSEPARTYDHPFFGTVTFDSQFEVWETQTTLGDPEQVSLTISLPEDDDPGPLGGYFDKAADIIRRLHRRTLTRWVAEAKLDLYNDVWDQGDDHDGDLDLEGFCARIRLSSLHINPGDEVYEIWFSDGGLFLGHSILLTLDEQLQFDEAKLVG